MKDKYKEGFAWALYLFLALAIVKPLIFQKEITLLVLVIQIPFYLFAGFLMATVMRYFKKAKN